MSRGRSDEKAGKPVGFPPVALGALWCPHCQSPFTQEGRALRCATGHSFDLAKQGYVNLLGSGVGDTKEMVAARDEFLAAGHYAPLARLVAHEAARDLRRNALVVDAGTGTGYYLAATLARAPAASGLGMDTSTAALRRAARAHPGIGAVAWDLWKPWPLRAGSADVIMNIFAPRNLAECHRILRPDGTLVVVTPDSMHLSELRTYMDMLEVDADKLTRLDSSLQSQFSLTGRHDCEIELTLDPPDVHRVVHMGPNAYHVPPAALAAIRRTLTVTAAFVVSVYRREP
ncbi:putative RNA methyltransferase [Kibdelosporangium persicum]|uniref:Ribosomal RNA large subunit methyltransferase A n=1 Tax=Kibdelosporangium persicum TaxID=2698649 RepID=A0ABX2FD89_9PSEU|nr:methyltransferase domain-containing protein [Kibdelosporangium persicum]NRN69327.1 Ribosomal RNA large subunit methyltransferase A [Kibdelosporangium persicum]